MSDFNDRPFVAGSIVGLRAFDVDKLGRLVGPHRGGIFKPGENEAECRRDTSWESAFSRALSASAMWHVGPVTYNVANRRPKPHRPATEESEPEHIIGSADCSCGFYAYTDGSNQSMSEGTVAAIIEGYGVCTVGERGFRASKGKLVALVLPKSKRRHTRAFDKLSDHLYDHDWGVAVGVMSAVIGAAFSVIAIGFAIADPSWLNALSIAPFIGLLGFGTQVLRAESHGIERAGRTTVRCHDHHASRHRVARLRLNYPDVPIYSGVGDALAAHPLTQTHRPPSPDDEDFWTREVA